MTNIDLRCLIKTMGRTDHDTTIFHHGPRDEVTLTVTTDDPSRERIQVQCSVCDRVFSIPRNSKGREVYNAKAVHCKPVNKPASSTAISAATTLAFPAQASPFPTLGHTEEDDAPMVVPPTPDGRRFLKWAKVDDVIRSVQREDSSGVPMLHAQMIDKTLHLLGAEVPQATAYPQVMYNKGSVVDLDDALRKCSEQFRRSKAYRQKRNQMRLESNKEWRERMAAFALLADPKICRPEDFTADNLDKCIDLLCETLPYDDNGIYDENGSFIGNPPRSGTHVPAHYLWDLTHDCILDYHPVGSADSPVRLLPVLIDIVARDRRSHRHLCVLQLPSGEYIKTWMSIYDDGPSCLSQMEQLFPQVRALLERPKFQVAFEKGEAFPPPERVVAKLENVLRLTSNQNACLMIEFKQGQDAERPLTALLGLKELDVVAPVPADYDGGAERRLELKYAILESKARECLELIAIVRPDDGMLTPAIDEIRQYKLDGPTNKGATLESHTKQLLQHVGTLNLRVTPRKLPPFTSTEALESYITCNSLHHSIAAHHARQGDRGGAIQLDKKSAEQLEKYWSTLTQ